jgi:hypothetical protein
MGKTKNTLIGGIWAVNIRPWAPAGMLTGDPADDLTDPGARLGFVSRRLDSTPV